MLELRCVDEFFFRNGQSGTVYFVLPINRVLEYLIQVIGYVFPTLPGRGRYPHQPFFRLEDDGMMGNKLIDGHFVGQSQVCVLQAFVVTQDRGGFGDIYRKILINEFR